MSFSKVMDKAIKACDVSTGHKVVVFVENYLRSIGKNNSTGKYDKIVHGVRSLLSQSLLDDEGLKKHPSMKQIDFLKSIICER